MFNPRAWIALPLVLAACGGASIRVDAGPPSTTVTVSVPAETSSTTTTTTSTTVPEPSTTMPAPTTTIAELQAAESPTGPETAPEPEPTTTTARKPTTGVSVYVNQGWERSLEPCGGDLPPCWVKAKESGGDYNAVNWRGCGGRGCFGAWQFDPRTSQGMGYPGVASDYPPEIQDEMARALWNGGKGCGQWSGPGWTGCGG